MSMKEIQGCLEDFKFQGEILIVYTTNTIRSVSVVFVGWDDGYISIIEDDA